MGIVFKGIFEVFDVFEIHVLQIYFKYKYKYS